MNVYIISENKKMVNIQYLVSYKIEHKNYYSYLEK